MAAVITVAITLIAGAALYGFVNGQAAASESGLGAANAANVNFLNERFVVVDMGFTANTVTLYLYNNGNLTLHLKEIVLHDATRESLYAIFNGTASGSPETTCGSLSAPIIGSAGTFEFESSSQQGSAIPRDSTVGITLTVPSGCLNPNNQPTTYYAIAVGWYGSTTVYYQCDSATGQEQGCLQ